MWFRWPRSYLENHSDEGETGNTNDDLTTPEPFFNDTGILSISPTRMVAATPKKAKLRPPLGVSSGVRDTSPAHFAS